MIANRTIPSFARVACLQPSATSTLGALGMLDRVVACTRHCAALCTGVDMSRVTVIEDSWTAQAEQVIAARPDLIIASVPYQTEAVAEILKAGARVLLLAPKTLADVYGDIAGIAGIMRVPERGDQVISKMQEEIEAVHSRTAGLPRPRVYCEEWGKPIIVAQRWVAEMVEAAGGAFTGDPGRQICADDMRAHNPEVIVFGWCGTGDRVPAEEVIAAREWQEMDAVRNGRVHVVRDDFLTTPGPTLSVGLRALAHAIQPELFPAEPRFSGQSVMRKVFPMRQDRGPAVPEPGATSNIAQTIAELDKIAASADSSHGLMTGIVETLSARMPHYNWVGFYLIEQQEADEPVLVLGPFVGAPTPHTRIPLNQGICGAAASSGQTVVVDDVNSDPRYLACSIETRSEIVVPVYARGEVIGELDIDSHYPAAFGAEDRQVCEHAARLVGSFMEQKG